MDTSNAILTWNSNNVGESTTAWVTFNARPLYSLEYIVRDILKSKFINFGMFKTFSMSGAEMNREEFIREIKASGVFSFRDNEDETEWYSVDEFTSTSYTTWAPDPETPTLKCLVACGPNTTLIINCMDSSNRYIEIVMDGRHAYYKFG